MADSDWDAKLGKHEYYFTNKNLEWLSHHLIMIN